MDATVSKIKRELKGFILLIWGCMFSGKTEMLIAELNRSMHAKHKCQLFKPAIDDRYDEQDVVSHNKTSAKANGLIPVVVKNASDILDLVEADTDVVGIDEAQFFGDDLITVCEQLANKGIEVVVAALDKDFQGKPFGCIPILASLAEYTDKVYAVCPECGDKKANFSYRITDDTNQILVGEKDAYMPLCRRCFVFKMGTRLTLASVNGHAEAK